MSNRNQRAIQETRASRGAIGFACFLGGLLLGGGIWAVVVDNPDGPAHQYDPYDAASPSAVHTPQPKIHPPDPVMGPSPIETPTASVPTPSGEAVQAGCIEQLPQELKINQKLMIGARADNLNQISAVAAKFNVGGIILMDEVPADAIAAFKEAQLVAPLISTDQEGGKVQRFKSEGALPAAADVPEHYNARSYRQLLLRDDGYLHQQGVNMNLGPVVDVAPGHNKGVLGSRMYSSVPDKVTTYADAAVDAAIATGVLPTLKHFPGEGSVSGDTDITSATTDSYDTLQANGELKPYEDLGKYGVAIMVGNQVVPGLSDNLPMSLSSDGIARARSFGTESTVIITDSLDAKAITENSSVAEAAAQSALAGSDIELAVTAGPQQSFRGMIKKIDQKMSGAIKDGGYTEEELNKSVERLFSVSQKKVDACDVLAKVQE